MSKKELSFDEISGLVREGLTKAVTRPTIHGYIPHDKQIRFHTSQDKGRLYIGGNRSGKTVGGIVEDIYRMRGVHPYQNVPSAPTRGRIVTVSYTEGIELIIIPELAKWLPPSDLINGSWEDSYNKQLRQLTLANGSTVELMSYDQKLEKFAGTSRHWTHFDEEPPKAIFNECKMRLIDTAGCWYITMTPVEGMTWVYDEVYLPGLVPGGNITVIIIDSAENPYISKAEVEAAISGLDENEKKARKEGKFVQIGGLAFPRFEPEVHIIPALTPEKLQKILQWTHYSSMDHGFNNPTSWHWHAVNNKNLVITYDELYDSQKVVSYYANEIKRRNNLPNRRTPDINVGDPAIKQRNGQTGDSIQIAYIQQGIPLVLGNNNIPIGVEKMNRYLENNKWFITEDCPNLIRQLQRVRWKIYETAKMRHDNNLREELHKKDDHATDDARYFFSLMPDLHLPQMGPMQGELSANEIVKQALGAVTPQIGLQIDEWLREMNKPQTEWSHIDEHLGGIW